MADRTAASTVSGPPQRRQSLPSLTGLRFLAAMLVFLTHATLLAGPLRPTAPISFFNDQDIAKALADFFQFAGPIGVSFFFVLSGFVLTWSATQGDPVTGFWRRRVLKIYPNHIVTWALAMWLFASSSPVHAWLPNLLLVHNFSNRPETVSSVNLPAWSLCSEVLFYALFPLFIVLVRRIAQRRLWLWAAAMVAGVAGVTLVTRFIPGGVPVPGYGLTTNQLWFSYGFPPPRLFEFVLGMILARIVAADLWPRIGLLPSAALFAGGYWVALAVPSPYNFSLATIVPVGMIICAAATSDLRGSRGWLSSRTMVWLGSVSFAFYLVQGLVIFYGRPEVFGARTYDTLPALGMLSVLFAANLLAAWLLFSLVEQPVMRRWSRSRKRPAPVAPRSTESVPAGGSV
ncbi:acyltransferase [Streptomyces sp. NBC_00080]|uniref:acyltransferase family protein n=1 Tax=unclassified Streptomyces TaxID=2593676 RepID=UPI001150BDBA|nr:acyltransferase [Streptomyces sp. SLBN-115]